MARIVVPGAAYHITHRGNRREPVFFDDADREYYLYWMRRCAEDCGVEVWAYCLMSNHVHLVATGREPDSLSKTMARAHRRQARWINLQRGWSGHLWANRFHSSLLDEVHLRNAIRYVELNPVRAGLVARAEDYRWSSARFHCFGAEDLLVSTALGYVTDGMQWAEWLAEGLPGGMAETLRRNTATGRPTADPDYVRLLERRLARTIQPRRRGRKTATKQGQLPNSKVAGEIG
jgi:putative transposase